MSAPSAQPPPDAPGRGDHVFLVDGSGYIFRAYHGLPPLTRASDGLPVGAVSGFCAMLIRLLRDAHAPGPDRPSHMAVAFDLPGPTFRNGIYPDYKANRPPAPADLVPQFALVHEATRAFAVPALVLEGFEADDIIATYATCAANAGARTTIVSSDKDFMQLVGRNVTMLDTMKKDRRMGPAEVMDKFGVSPELVVDVQALAGDASDNVPGVPGIGIKTAAQLVNAYGSLDAVLDNAENIRQPRRRDNLLKFADKARLSRKLVRLDRTAPVTTPFADMRLRLPDPAALIGFLKTLELFSLVRRVAATLEVDPQTMEPRPVAITAWPPHGEPEEGADAGDADAGGTDAGGTDAGGTSASQDRPAGGVVGLPPAPPGDIDRSTYETVTSAAALRAWVEAAAEDGVVAVDTETDSLDAQRARLVGVSLALPGRACYVPLQHIGPEGLDLDNTANAGATANAGEKEDRNTGTPPGTPQQIPLPEALALLKPLLEDPGVLKVGQNIKYDMTVLANLDIRLGPVDDTMLMSYALDTGRHGHGMDELSKRHLRHEPLTFSQVTGTGKSRVTFDRVPLDRATAYAAEDADITLRLARVLKPRLRAERMNTLYQTLELPLIGVLVDMERAGVRIDRDALAQLSGEFEKKMRTREEEIHDLAGTRFNIASSQQLGQVLFATLGLQTGRKTATGAWSTAAGTLEKLAADGHELPRRILDWRQLAKLKSTYTDALPTFIHPRTGRVHTSYAMAATTTGRLASRDPNLQNIPIRTSDGKRIRAAFIAAPGCVLVSADYSQIELRILAHVAGVDALKQAFRAGQDIHAITASEIFGVPVDGMDPDIRRRAKAINFGIIYGISAFGLANQLGISRTDAADYINAYFRKFPGIRDYMGHIRQACRRDGCVWTLFGRKAHFTGMETASQARRAFMERAAINAPIQGAAADIMRRAMTHIPAALEREGLKARMLMQVHDELVFEAPEAEADRLCAVASEVMARAAEPAVALSVPLEVAARAGANWDEAH